jgi:hypothetical protein
MELKRAAEGEPCKRAKTLFWQCFFICFFVFTSENCWKNGPSSVTEKFTKFSYTPPRDFWQKSKIRVFDKSKPKNPATRKVSKILEN